MNELKSLLRSSGAPASAILAGLVALAAVGSARAATAAPTGVWMWDDGRAAVEFHMCGDDLCGRIVWLKQDSTPNARPTLDVKAPDPAQRRRRICGLDYITGVKSTNDRKWKHGRIYDFNSGSSYDLDIDSIGAESVNMRGYKGMRMLGDNLTLLRTNAELSLCKSASQVN